MCMVLPSTPAQASYSPWHLKDDLSPSKFKYCGFLQAIVRRMGKGKSADSKQEFEEYRENQFLTPNPGSAYCWLPDVWSMEADGLDTAGMSLSSHQFVRKGRVMCRDNPKPHNLKKSNPPKFNTAQKGP